MLKFILFVYHHFALHKAALWGLLLLLIALFALASSRIHFKEDISGFLSKGPDSERIGFAYQHIGVANKLMVNIAMADADTAPDMALLTAAIDHFTQQIAEGDSLSYIRKMDYKLDQQQIFALSRFLVENMPYFLTETDYQRMDTLLTIAYIQHQLNEDKRLLVSPIGMALKQNILADPLHIAAPLLSHLRDFQANDQYRMYDDYIFTKDKRKGIITLESAFPVSETNNNAGLIDLINRVALDTQVAFDQKVVVKYFGAVDVAVTNARQIKQDSMISMLLALALIFALLLYAFRNLRSLLIILVSLLFGWLFAFGVLAVLKTEVSLIAVGIASIIIGIAVNYPLHFLDHYRHEQDVKTVIKHIVVPLLIGNITTVGAFLSLVFINSEAMRDLGLFASFLLVGTILFVLLFLPHLLKKRAGKAGVMAPKIRPVFGKLTEFAPEKKHWFIGIILLLSVVFCGLSFNTKFETDMHRINYMTDEQKEAFAEMIAALNKGEETVYYVSEGATMDEALTAYEQSKVALADLRAAGKISQISGIGDYLPSKAMQQQRLDRWQQFWNNHRDLIPLIDQCAVETGFRQGTFSGFARLVTEDFAVRETAYFAPISETLATNYIAEEPGRYMVMNILRTPEKDLQTLETTLADINEQSFAFDAGTISRTMVNALTGDFNTVLYICGFIVFVFLLFTLGRVELSLLAFLPLMIGWCWILGIMNLFDIRFNIVNIILATLIFGQGDDYTIFITEGLMYEYTYNKKLLASYKNSIALSAVIMFIGIGSLIISKHPALHSLAEVTIIGMFSVVLMTFIFPPLIFNRLTLKKGQKRLMPVTLVNLLSSIYAFTVFLSASLGITIAGFFLIDLSGESKKNKLRYLKLLCRTARFVLFHIPNVKSYFDNKSGETFEKPAIIICNHQSHIDLMCIMMLHPKIIILTNDWVWNSPFYGRLVKFADYYPVSNGVDNAIDNLKAAVDNGYSIMIFPEGTRSEDCAIQRFHKGAFYLAEQLQLDILPILIHGVGHLLPKKEFMLRKGEIHIRVMNRIRLQDADFGNTYRERTKNIRKYYIEQYAQLSQTVETPDYYADLVYHNYIYKGPTVERTVRANLKKYQNFRQIISESANCKRVLVQNCGYGEFPLLLALVNKQIQVTATDPDEDRLALAANCASVPANLHYVSQLAEKEEYDKIINLSKTLSDYSEKLHSFAGQIRSCTSNLSNSNVKI
jgi:1-acyl-sn-glycerol-3-phosphate acyltransferase